MKGVKELQSNLRKIENWTHNALIGAMEQAANNVVTHAKAEHEFVGPTSGASVPYIREHTDPRFFTHTAVLVNSINSDRPVQIRPNGLLKEVYAAAPYAAHVELGTSKSRPFPFLSTALIATGQANVNLFVAATKRVLS